MKPSEWNEKIKTRVRVKFELELDVHTAGETNAQALGEAVRLVGESLKKQELEYCYSWAGAWIEECKINHISCAPLEPIRYVPIRPEPENNEAPETEPEPDSTPEQP
jgi:hypothetical protein